MKHDGKLMKCVKGFVSARAEALFLSPPSGALGGFEANSQGSAEAPPWAKIRRPSGAMLGWILVVLAGLVQGPVGAQDGESVQDASIDALLNIAQQHTYEDHGQTLEAIRARVLEVQLKPAARNELAEAMASKLSDEASTYPFKVFVCRQLYLIGGDEQVDDLVPLLADPALADIARYALEVIPSPKVNELLWEAAGKAPASVAAGIASTLAARGGQSAVPRLAILAEREEVDVMRAAIVGMGRVGGAQAESSLRIALVAAPETLQAEVYEALLGCAEAYRAAGENTEAERLYLDLLEEDRPIHVRVAAFNGYVGLHGEAASPRVADALSTEETVWVRVALGHVRSLGGPESTELFCQQLVRLFPGTRAMLVEALGDRGDASALPYVFQFLVDPDEGVRLAVIEALGVLGNETTVLSLLDLALSEDVEVAQRAKSSLVTLADAGVNGALLGTYEQAYPEGKALLAEILADRRALGAAPLLIDTADMETGDVREAAYRALGRLARYEDMPGLTALFYAAEDETERNQAADALTAAFRRIPASDDRTAVLRGLYTDAPSSITRAAILSVYRALGDDALLPVLQEAVGTDDAIIAESAVAALTGWPDSSPIKAVLAIAKGSGPQAHRAVALDGFLRMIRLDAMLTEEERIAGYREALTLSDDTDTKRKVLAGISELASVDALGMAEGMMSEPELAKDATVAAEKIRSKHYVARASVASDAAQQAVDGSIYSFWQTPGPQEAGQWIEIDLFRRASVKGVVLDTSRTKAGYPRGYNVYLYEEGGLPGEPVAVGEGSEGVTTIEFARPVSGRVLRIEQTGTTDDVPWVIHEVRVIPE